MSFFGAFLVHIIDPRHTYAKNKRGAFARCLPQIRMKCLFIDFSAFIQTNCVHGASEIETCFDINVIFKRKQKYCET